MKNTLFTLSLFFFTSLLFAQNDARFNGLDKELNDILEATKAAGFAVAIVEKDKIIYSKGFGYRDFENKIPADENTLFAIGSSSKAFTSSLLGLLRDEGKLSFDDSPIKHIPELTFFNDEMNSNIVIKDLMCHRTGLPRHDFSWYLFPTYDKDSLLMRIAHHEPFAGVREQWYYNNFMFLTQGVITERITGKSWEENIEEKIFAPLDMNRSNTSIDELEKSTNASFGYELKKDSIISKMDYYHIAAMGPAGSINSSVKEMSNWLITWINKGQFEGEEVIPETYIDEAIGAQMVVHSRLPNKDTPDIHLTNYGYAWFISSYKGHYRVEHGGNIDGFSANVAFFPSDSVGIVVLTNQNGSSVPKLVRNTISDRLLDVNKTNWIDQFKERQQKNKDQQEEAEETQNSSRKEHTKPSHNLIEYTGTYSHPGYGDIVLSVERDSLFGKTPHMNLWLKHYHYDIFEPFEVEETGIDTTEAGPLKFNFTSNETGDISGVKLKMEIALDPIEFKRTPNTLELDKSDLEKYVGEYDVAGTMIKIYVKQENTLFAYVAGQPEYELLATEKDIFVFKIMDGFKINFLADEEGKIKELLMIQPNGTFKATKK